jgi:hypothetical protein
MKRILLPVALLALMAGSTLPARAADPAPPAVNPAGGPGGEASQRAIPEINFTSVPVDDVIVFLRDNVPGFQAVTVRDPDVPAGEPQVTLNLRNVTLDQLIAVLSQAYPSLEWSTAPGTTIHVVRVHAASGLTASRLHVYSLSQLVGNLAGALQQQPIPQPGFGPGGAAAPPPAPGGDMEKQMQETRKRALNNVLSVIKAALAQVPDGNSAVLQVHEETETLIFKGTPQQQEAVEQVLAALSGSNGVMGDMVNSARLDAQHAAAAAGQIATGMQKRLIIMGEHNDENVRAEMALQSQLQAAQREIEQLRARVNAMHPGPTTQPQ